MSTSTHLLDWLYELGPWLRRAFWQPLHQLLEIFHIFPLLAALVVFGLLAGDGQLREIYLSYLESLKSEPLWSAISLAAAAFSLALISAVLFEAHYLLSTTRINVIYSTNAKPGGGSKLRGLQRNAAIALALSPWMGIAFGLFGAKVYLSNTFTQALFKASIDLDPAKYLPDPSRWAVVSCIIALGIAASLYVEADPQIKAPQRTAMALRPAIATFFGLLLADALPTSLKDLWAVIWTEVTPWVLGIAAVTVGYYYAYYWLHRRRLHFLYAHVLYRDTGVYLQRRQQILLFSWAFLPWLVVALYFCFPHSLSDKAHPYTIAAISICSVIAAGLLVALLLYRLRENPRLLWTVVITVCVLASAGLIASRFNADLLIAVYRFIGPLGTLALGLLFLISTFAVLAWLSVRSGFPALTLVTAALVFSAIFPVPIGITAIGLGILCALFGVLALVSRLGAVAAVAFLLAVPGAINAVKVLRIETVGLHSKSQAEVLDDGFRCWLELKGIPGSEGKPANCKGEPSHAANSQASSAAHKYPVFIVATEGGGIYAASAASLFLAGLQDRDPSFSKHMFAISGVSGGAIGATIFQALERSKISGPPPTGKVATTEAGDVQQSDKSAGAEPSGCLFQSFNDRTSDPKPSPTDSLTEKVSAIMQADHFSPVIAAIYPEILGFAFCERPDALAASFEQSVNSQDGRAARLLGAPYEKSWWDDSKAPALVLNATWAETGFRAAFAPFQLHAIDDSLYSFSDQDMPIESNMSLMNAAVVSARFPAVLPPYSISIDEEKNDPPTSRKKATMRWNFVDGGYSDNSGAATALAIYQDLAPIAASHNVELRIILLTSSKPVLDPAEIRGTEFGDTVAPMDAVLNVREGLGNEAVARACSGVLKSACPADPCKSSLGDEPDLQIIEIPDQTYKLPLGWKLSHTTFGLVRWMIGTPNASSTAIPPVGISGQNEGDELKVTTQNGCVLKSILQTLADWKSPQSKP
jgi:hypothetical protein